MSLSHFNADNIKNAYIYKYKFYTGINRIKTCKYISTYWQILLYYKYTIIRSVFNWNKFVLWNGILKSHLIV
jgi:hypothetical protein